MLSISHRVSISIHLQGILLRPARPVSGKCFPNTKMGHGQSSSVVTGYMIFRYALAGVDSIRLLTWQIFKQNRFGQVMKQCCKYTMFRQYTTEFHLKMFGGAIVGAMRRRCFPGGEITGRIAAPTTPRNFRSVIRWHRPCRGGCPPSVGGKLAGTRRRSRPWLPLWGSWRAISEPERAFTAANLENAP